MVGVAGALEFFRMAGIALRREPLELSRGGSRMAGFAINGSVRANQREAVLVVTDRRYRYLPALDGVAGLAVRAELAAVNVRMAVRAFLSHVGEDQLHVALDALHLFVHAIQRVVSFVVVKFGDAADGLPTQGRMTVLAGNIESAMRIARDRFLRRTMRPLSVGLKRKQKNSDVQQPSSRHGHHVPWHPNSVPWGFARVGGSLAAKVPCNNCTSEQF